MVDYDYEKGLSKRQETKDTSTVIQDNLAFLPFDLL